MAHPLSLGFIGRNGAYPANQAGRHADLVVAIGARFDDRSASSWLPGYSWNFPHTRLIHVDVDHGRRVSGARSADRDRDDVRLHRGAARDRGYESEGGATLTVYSLAPQAAG